MYRHGVEIKFKNLPMTNCYFGIQNIESLGILKLVAKPSKFLQKEMLKILDQAWLAAGKGGLPAPRLRAVALRQDQESLKNEARARENF